MRSLARLDVSEYLLTLPRPTAALPLPEGHATLDGHHVVARTVA